MGKWVEEFRRSYLTSTVILIEIVWVTRARKTSPPVRMNNHYAFFRFEKLDIKGQAERFILKRI